MNKVKILALVLLAVIILGLVNSVTGLVRVPSYPGNSLLKVKVTTKPWIEARHSDPMRVIPGKPDRRGELLKALKAVEDGQALPEHFNELIDGYRDVHRAELSTNPWYLFYEALACRLVNRIGKFEILSTQLVELDSIDGDLLSFMGSKLDSRGFYDEAWWFYREALKQYVKDGSSLDESTCLIMNQFFFPVTRLKKLAAAGEMDIVLKRLNSLMKLNPRIEGMYWIYMQLAEYFAGQNKPELAGTFRKLAGKVFDFPVIFTPSMVLHCDYLLNAIILIGIMFPVYLAALRLKYRQSARHMKRHSRENNGQERRFSLSWKHSPFFFLKPREFLFILLLSGAIIVLFLNVFANIASIGRGAALPINFALGRHTAPDSVTVMSNLEAHFKDTPEFVRFFAYHLALNGRFNESRRLLQTVLEKNPEDVPALVNLAVIEHREGNNGQSRKLITKAVKFGPDCLEVHHNYRIITGETSPYPSWFSKLKESDDLAATARMVLDNFESLWPNAAAYSLWDDATSLFMSDRGTFLRWWGAIPKTLLFRVRGFLELTGLLNSGNRMSNPFDLLFKNTVSSRMFLLQLLVALSLGYFCMVMIKAANDPESRNIKRCDLCRAVVCGRCEAGAGDTEAGILCETCVREQRYGDDGFLDETSRFTWIRRLPFIGNFAGGHIITGTATLLLFIYCLGTFVFTHSAALGAYGASGIISAISVPNITITPVEMTLTVHYESVHTLLLVFGMAVSVAASLAAARQTG